MLTKLPWEWRLPALCVLFATICCGGLVNRDPEPTEAPPASGKENTTLTHLSHRLTLEPGEYEILPNGTLHVLSRSNHSVNSSSSYAEGGDGEAMCLPACKNRFLGLKPFYYGLVAVFLFLQVPLFVCGSWSFNRWNPLAYVLFFYTVAMAFVTAPLCRLPEYPSAGFIAIWYSLPSYLSVSGVHIAGALALLHSDVVLAHLASAGHVYVKKGTVFVQRRDDILKGTAYFAAVIFLVTYGLGLSRAYERITGGPGDFSSLRNNMPYFLPSTMLHLFVNTILAGRLSQDPPPVLRGDEWRPVRKRHPVFFAFFVGAFFNWMFGFVVTVTGCWSLWDAFAVFSAALPVLLGGYVFQNSRRVIYASRRCVKILETDGEVLTIWSHRPKRSKQPAEMESVLSDAKKLSENPKPEAKKLPEKPKGDTKELPENPKLDAEELSEKTNSDENKLPKMPKLEEELTEKPKVNTKEFSEKTNSDENTLPEMPMLDTKELFEKPKVDTKELSENPDTKELPENPKSYTKELPENQS